MGEWEGKMGPCIREDKRGMKMGPRIREDKLREAWGVIEYRRD